MISKCYMAAATAFIIFATSTASVSAQPAPAPAPIVNDIPANATLPSDGVFDITGLALGMTFTEIVNKYKQLAPQEAPKVTEMAAGMRDNRGNAVSFAYQSQSSIRFGNSDGATEEYSVYFTTKINESRAVRIARKIFYGSGSQQASVPALIEGLNKKYGVPSYTKRKDRTIEIAYIWFEGKRTALPEKIERMRYRDGHPASCTTMATSIAQYQFSPNRRDPRPGCNASLVINIWEGTRGDLAESVLFEMTDKVRHLKNGIETDAWLKQKLDEKIAGQAGANAPKL